MMVNFNDNYLNAAEIIAVLTDNSGRADYPYKLTVKLRAGGEYSVIYTSMAALREERYRITEMANRACPEPVSRYEVEACVSSAVEKIRRDLREIKKLLKGGSE